MILVWRGWGLLAAVMWIPILGSCAGLATIEPRWIFGAVLAVAFLAAGVVCVYYGTRWNRPVVDHSFYFLPLQVWGWGYLAVYMLMAGMGFIGAIAQGLGKPESVPLASASGVGVLIGGVCVYLLIRSARSLPVVTTETPTEPDAHSATGGKESQDEGKPRRPWER